MQDAQVGGQKDSRFENATGDKAWAKKAKPISKTNARVEMMKVKLNFPCPGLFGLCLSSQLKLFECC